MARTNNTPAATPSATGTSPESVTHTPGPWTLERDVNAAVDKPCIIIRGPRLVDRTFATRDDVRKMAEAFQKVAYVYTPTEPVGTQGGQKVTIATIAESEANARLICAAPDLLAACEAAQGVLTDGHELVWQQLTAAIEKASPEPRDRDNGRDLNSEEADEQRRWKAGRR